MTADPDCLFCKIVAGDIPGEIVHTGERTIAFRDIMVDPLGADDTVQLTGPRGTLEVPVTTRYRLNSAVALLDAVRAGAGIAFQPCWTVNELLRRKELVRLLPQWTGPSQTVYLVYPPRRRQPMRVQVMLDALATKIRAL